MIIKLNMSNSSDKYNREAIIFYLGKARYKILRDFEHRHILLLSYTFMISLLCVIEKKEMTSFFFFFFISLANTSATQRCKCTDVRMHASACMSRTCERAVSSSSRLPRFARGRYSPLPALYTHVRMPPHICVHSAVRVAWDV